MSSRLAKRPKPADLARIDGIAAGIARILEQLETCTRFDQARALAGAAETAEAALHALDGSLRLQNEAAHARLKAERWMGRFLIKTVKPGNPKLSKGAGAAQLVKLADLKITRKQSARWKELAEISDAKFVEHVVGVQERGEKLTTSGTIAAASRAAGYDGDESYTPVEYIEAAKKVMGGIDCDPAASSHPEVLARIGAKHAFTKNMEGQHRHWVGKVWLNPPYSTELIKVFVGKLLEELATNTGARTDLDQAIVLTNAATDTAWWQSLAQASALVCIVAGRINFEQPDPKKPGALKATKSNRFAQSFFYYGDRAQKFREVFQAFGVVGSLRVSGSAT